MKELLKLDKPIARRIASAVDDLGVQPRPQGARSLVGYRLDGALSASCGDVLAPVGSGTLHDTA